MERRLAQVEQRLIDVVSGSEALARAQAHLVRAPLAKRLRPRALLLFADMVGARTDASLVDDAVAIELIHTASLLHDDVVDHARVRRGRPSANALFSDGVALLAGDELLAKALKLCSPAVVPAAIDAVAAMARAAMLEVELRGRADAPRAHIVSIIDGKTAALFALAGFSAGARRDAATASGLWRAGRALGRAFQIRDDVDDLVRADAERGNDLRERTPTLPLSLLADTDPALSAALARLWRSADPPRADVDALLDAIAQSGALARALDQGRAEVDELLAVLEPYAGSAAHRTVADVAADLVADVSPASTTRGAA